MDPRAPMTSAPNSPAVRALRLAASRLVLCSLALVACSLDEPTLVPGPIDPQIVQDQDDMTWDDYRPIPGIDWADRTLVPERGFKLAVLAMDFPDQPFVITLPRSSDPFGNPQIEPIAREDVPRFYADFWMTPSELNHGQTINGYWMEQSRGAFGITEADSYGPYRMPRSLWEYGLNEWGQNESTPDGTEASHRMEPDVDSLWRADVGDVIDDYDAVLRIYAGYDETGVWQEFGEMKFDSRDEIPSEWGNPNPEMPRWVPTRYVEWTSWLAGAQQWGLSSMRQGENSGTITHELGHFAFGIPDLNNNPYVQPYRRVAAGPWDMMDRGSFNGPGGPHTRWVVPPTRGASMPAGLMMRNRLENEFIDPSDVLTLSREGLGESGLVVASVTARAVEPRPGTFAGIIVRLDGTEPHDRTPPDDPATDPLSAGVPEYDFYSLEVVQRIGYDSFAPDEGVLIAKNKDSMRGRNGGPNAFNSFIWVIDAHPEDMNRVDFVRPDGAEVMRTVADYRQLNDALFHAGLGSGSEFEWQDAYNGLHFYVLDVQRDDAELLSYSVGVRSLEGQGPHRGGVDLAVPEPEGGAALARASDSPYTVTLSNSGSAVMSESTTAAADTEALPFPDIYRLSVSVVGGGWSARILNELVAVQSGDSTELSVYVTADPGGAETATVTLSATSESDETAIASVTWSVRR